MRGLEPISARPLTPSPPTPLPRVQGRGGSVAIVPHNLSNPCEGLPCHELQDDLHPVRRLALVLIGLTIALYVSPTPKDEDKSVFPSVNSSSVKSNPDEVERVEIVRTSPEEKLTFVKDPSTKRWRVNGFRANANSVKNLISKIYDAKKTETEAARNLGEWGLENPQTVVTLRRGDKSALTLSIGKTSPGDDASAVTYVLSSDRPKDPMGVLKISARDRHEGPGYLPRARTHCRKLRGVTVR